MCLAPSTVGGGESGGPAADNQLTSLIAVVRGANENKCEPLHRANTANGSETARTWAGLRSRCWVFNQMLDMLICDTAVIDFCASLGWMRSAALI